MIRVALMRGGREATCVGFDAVPLEKEDGFRCIPDGGIGFESANQISVELHQGRLTGRIDGQAWYRQAGT